MAHRRSAVLPGQRRRRRAGVQASDSNLDLGRVGSRRSGACDLLRRPDARRSITTSTSAGISSTSRTTAAGCACSTPATIALGALREVGFFDIYPADDAPGFNGAWTSYPFFASGSVIVNGIEQGLFVVRPRQIPQGLPFGLSVTISRTRRRRARPGTVLRRPDRQPWTRSALGDSADRNAAGDRRSCCPRAHPRVRAR